MTKKEQCLAEARKDAYILYLSEYRDDVYWKHGFLTDGFGKMKPGDQSGCVIIDNIAAEFGFEREEYIVHRVGTDWVHVIETALPLVDSQYLDTTGGPFDDYVRLALNIPADIPLMYSRTYPETTI